MTTQTSDPDFDGIEIETGTEPRFAIIWLHGLGADGNDFVPLAAELRLPLPTRFVFPHAPVRPVTINGGYRMRAWYDILSFDRGAAEDAAGIEASSEFVATLVEREAARGVPPERVVVAGFSQGGAIALHTLLTTQSRLAGVVALSTYLPLADRLLAGRPDGGTAPAWMAHGNHDPVIDISFGRRSYERLRAAGVDVEWHAYQMPHSVCPEEIRDVGGWLTGLMRQSQTAARARAD